MVSTSAQESREPRICWLHAKVWKEGKHPNCDIEKRAIPRHEHATPARKRVGQEGNVRRTRIDARPALQKNSCDSLDVNGLRREERGKALRVRRGVRNQPRLASTFCDVVEGPISSKSQACFCRPEELLECCTVERLHRPFVTNAFILAMLTGRHSKGRPDSVCEVTREQITETDPSGVDQQFRLTQASAPMKFAFLPAVGRDEEAASAHVPGKAEDTLAGDRSVIPSTGELADRDQRQGEAEVHARRSEQSSSNKLVVGSAKAIEPCVRIEQRERRPMLHV